MKFKFKARKLFFNISLILLLFIGTINSEKIFADGSGLVVELKEESKNEKSTQNDNNEKVAVKDTNENSNKKETDKILKSRQFLTFETETGKEFVVVVDYYNTGKEARFLTELNEKDMKNLINFQNLNSDVKNNFTESKIENKEQTKTPNEVEKVEIQNENKEESKNEKETQKSTQNNSNKQNRPNVIPYVIIIGIMLILVGFLYFKKQKMTEK